MTRRLFDIACASLGLLISLPLLLLAALAIKLSSRGPVFHVAQRAGLNGVAFNMYKLRTMHVSQGGSVITATNDRRVFPAGRYLRLLKIDELPQLWNVLRGDMAIVGPRPEDPAIVEKYYKPWMLETLAVRPGLTSSGTQFFYAHADARIDDADPVGSYVSRLLEEKLAIDMAQINRNGVLSDAACVLRTFAVVILHAFGVVLDAPRKDIDAAKHYVRGMT